MLRSRTMEHRWQNLMNCNLILLLALERLPNSQVNNQKNEPIRGRNKAHRLHLLRKMPTILKKLLMDVTATCMKENNTRMIENKTNSDVGHSLHNLTFNMLQSKSNVGSSKEQNDLSELPSERLGSESETRGYVMINDLRPYDRDWTIKFLCLEGGWLNHTSTPYRLFIYSTYEGHKNSSCHLQRCQDWKYHIVPFMEIKHHAKNDSYIDVLGLVVNVDPLSSVTKFGVLGTSMKRNISLINSRSDIIILTLWGDLAKIEGDILEDMAKERPIVELSKLKTSAYGDEEHFNLEYMVTRGYNGFFYYDSLNIVLKGSTIEMKKILAVFSAIDLSRHKFEGEIPEIIGGLNSIRGLNLSHNSLTGHIPRSLGNMTKLECLDLSSNKLTGEIPQQLTNLFSLGTLNLSHNRLTGPIPQGKQFDTFSNDSYINNSALCRPPLSNTCGDPKATEPPPLTFEEEDSEPVSGFGWEVILPGYGFGLVVGLVMGYLMFSFGKPQRLVKMVEDVGNRKGKRLKSNAQRRGGRRN
ncbi:hypothetical protein RHGRI_000548 [Rhododendron griersonianum]|uniref:Replication protein A OB domain-containing protein n=1 Tax=Rhododendron griersonianum TaxID=479676 RepID=A0AAV6LJ79_9ERIC|nr:hypothetical protein RHGRI_000548 [Rhododendron griersonianum]